MAPGGNILITDTENGRIDIYSPTLSLNGSLGSFGTSLGKFRTPSSVAVAVNGNKYIADTGNSRVQLFKGAGGILSFGSGTPTAVAIAPSASPNAGQVYVANSSTNRIEVFSANGVATALVSAASLNNPQAIAFDTAGRLYVADTGNNRVQIFNSNLTPFATIDGIGTTEGDFSGPRGIAIDKVGRIYVTDTGHNRVRVFNANRSAAYSFSEVSSALLRSPRSIGINSEGRVFIADASNRIHVFVQAVAAVQNIDLGNTIVAGNGNDNGDMEGASIPSVTTSLACKGPPQDWSPPIS